MTKGRKVLLVAPLAVALLVGAWQGLRYAWYKGYSRGSRTGVIRKISVKGPPVCKFLSGEMALIGAAPGGTPEIFHFTVDDDSDGNPVVRALHEAEKTAKPITLDYRQDKGRWWSCASGETEYYITAVEK